MTTTNQTTKTITTELNEYGFYFCGYDEEGLMVSFNCMSSYEAAEETENQLEAEYHYCS